MDLFPLEKYMELAESIRFERPELDTIFLTTEMEVSFVIYDNVLLLRFQHLG